MRNLLEVRNISKTFKANKIEIEVLKDKPTATDFIYVEKSNNKVEVTFNVVDQEQLDELGIAIVAREDKKAEETEEKTEE